MNSVNIWMNNINKLYSVNSGKKKSIVGNIVTHNEIVYVRRLFVDWIIANENFLNLREYQSHKSILSKHIKVANDNKNNYFLLWIDFQKFLKYHGEFLLDVYSDMDNKNLSRFVKLVIFSIVAVNFFYKWRKMRNDSIRKWYGYDNRRKKASNVGMIYFDNLVLNEAKSYRYYNLYKQAVYIRYV